MQVQDPDRFLQMELSVKQWQACPPSVEAARPGCCPCCGAASRPPGLALQVVGHGLRVRQMWGPPEAGSSATTGEVILRRYSCRSCGAVLMVGPRGLRRRHLYTASAIALALWLWSLLRWSARRVRERVSPWRLRGHDKRHRWRSLQRWAVNRADAARRSQQALALGCRGVDGHRNPRVFGEARGLSPKSFTAGAGFRVGEKLPGGGASA